MSSEQPSIRAPERQLQPAPEDRLAALERVVRRFGDSDGLVKRGGLVTEVTPTHYKVRGLSDF
ncbi:MAG: flagellum-specific ATP synthase FliI, partial [Mesorhizobium sp.]